MSCTRLALFGLFPVVSAVGFAIELSASSPDMKANVETVLLVGLVCATAGFASGFLARAKRPRKVSKDWRASVYNPKEFRK
jgi:hypothetical protein